MRDKTFWCDFESARFPVSQLGEDDDGNPVHRTAGPCHYPNGNLCEESKHDPLIAPRFDLRRQPDELYELLPESHR